MSATHAASTMSAVENTCPTVRPLRRIRVLLADNSPDFQTVVGALIESEDSVEVVGRVGGPKEIIEASAALRPDLLLIELGPVKFVGLTTAALVSGTFPQLNIVLMGTTIHRDSVRNPELQGRGFSFTSPTSTWNLHKYFRL